jgi:hypothetical protein
MNFLTNEVALITKIQPKLPQKTYLRQKHFSLLRYFSRSLLAAPRPLKAIEKCMRNHFKNNDA